MKLAIRPRANSFAGLAGIVLVLTALSAPAEVIYEATTPYHFIRVIEERGLRILNFDNATQSRMSLQDPLQGHFEYTEYFQLPCLWNTQMVRVLMIGLGGGSTQRAFEHYCPEVQVETVELDPTVVHVARKFFGFQESPRQKIHVSDGRVFLRRCQTNYDCIILDAYISSRYGSCIPYHLATKEFFEMTSLRLTTNGVLAYNVIGQIRGWQSDIVGSMYKTIKAVFPQVYLFPARESQNVVFIATKSLQRVDLSFLRQRAALLAKSKQIQFPHLAQRVWALQSGTPPNLRRVPILTDDFAPIDNLLRSGAE